MGAQGTPGWGTGYVPTSAQWNTEFGSKADYPITANSDLSGGVVTPTGRPISRPLADRFAESVNVKDFGPCGAGVADSAPAINAAMAYCRTRNAASSNPTGGFNL